MDRNQLSFHLSSQLCEDDSLEKEEDPTLTSEELAKAIDQARSIMGGLLQSNPMRKIAEDHFVYLLERQKLRAKRYEN